MFNYLALVASSANQSENNPNSRLLVMLICLGAIVLAIVIRALVLRYKAKDQQIVKDEKYYLREIRNHVRIIAIVILLWAILSVLSWILAMF